MNLRKTIPKGSKIRVLVVDDSVVIRRLVTQALEEVPDIEIAGSAANGKIALQRIPQVNPDAITLDIEMPEMNGIEAVREIKKAYPHVRVIMFSTLTQRGATSTIEALSHGADDYVTKASNYGSLDKSMTSLRDELVPKIKQFFILAGAAPALAAPRLASIPRPTINGARPAAGAYARKALVIGVSTGGPVALSRIIPMFPNDFPAPILIVQHMPPMFTRMLAERLQTQTKLRVTEAAEGDAVTPGRILIAPGDFHMKLRRLGNDIRVHLDQGPQENSCRPAVDVLFRSAAEIYGKAAVGAVLTGMGQDGLRGVETLKAQGAYIIAQDEASSVVWGMPGAVANAGLADTVTELDSVVGVIRNQFMV